MEKDRIDRKSNFELLRIIAMLMIVGSHFAAHGVVNTLNLPGGGIRQYCIGSFANKIFVCTLQPGGTVGVALFFLISGYFLINKESAHFSKVLLEGLFYGISCGIIAFLLRVTHVANYMSYWQIAQGVLVSVTNGYVWWFISVYILLMIMVPWLNRFFRCSSRGLIVITLAVLWIFPYSLDIIFGGIFTSLVKGIFYYLLGGYIHLYFAKNEKWHKRVLLIIFTVSWIVYTAVFFMINGEIIQRNLVIRIANTAGESILAPLCSVSLFLLIKDFEIRSRTINNIASTTFGMYLISDFPVLRMFIWENIWHVQDAYVNSSFFIAKGLTIIVVTCVVCGLIDYIRMKTIEPHSLRAWSRIIYYLKDYKKD